MTKAEIVDVQTQNRQLRGEVDQLSEQYDKEQQLHQDAISEVNKRGDELQTQDRRLSECRQQIIILEGEHEEGSDSLQRVQTNLEDYKQKYQDNMEHITHVENSLHRTQESLDDAKAKVH